MNVESLLFSNALTALNLSDKITKEKLEDLASLASTEEKMRDWLSIDYNEHKDIFGKVLILFQSSLMDWEETMRESIAYFKSKNIPITTIHMKQPIHSIVSIALALYLYLFNESTSTYPQDQIKKIAEQMNSLESELYIINEEREVVQIRDAATYYDNIEKLIPLIEQFYWQLKYLIRDSWI